MNRQPIDNETPRKRPTGSKVLKCPYCGTHYNRTNFMTRRNSTAVDGEGRRLTNTHTIACYRKCLAAAKGTEFNKWTNYTRGGDYVG